MLTGVVRAPVESTQALEQAGLRLVEADLAYCLEHPRDPEADGYPINAVQRIFMKLA
ncbi:MAG: hypothetical protein ACLPR9_19310 [Acidimicrobiales bacterium]